MSSKKTLTIGVYAALATLTLAACGGGANQASHTASASASASSSATASAPASAPASTTASATSQVALAVHDAWVKAASSNMTGAFATITNESDQPITIEGASATSAGMVELHTTEIDAATGTSTMKKVEGGFTLEPGATLELAPGGDHIMLMDMKCSLVAGSTAVITLDTSAGELSFEAVVRDYEGAKEEYAPGDHSGHETMGTTESSDGHKHSHAAEEAAVLPQCA
ncbi:copper chaperone PCu(A)C [Rothia nasimurium]|uniref:copper chaperone PCu(A)C n=1 Tax=Rothia nasimurium TaxID=85336 RepID=UPI001F24D7CD|nr:copper chaperone PCu(A)C [Rothia nasimurium]